jgi:arylsulfatase A-like enzyme
MPPSPHRNARRPNILFIVTDDQRFDTLGLTDPATGHPWMAKTLGWFGRTGDAQGSPVGTEFTNAFATTPLCCPSRASILTGKYAHNHGVFGNFDKDNLDPTTTLQHHLKSQPSPYHTGIFGKYLNNWMISAGNPPKNPPDFDEWAIFDNGTRVSHTPPPPCPNPDKLFSGVDCVNDQGRLGQIPPNMFETTYLANKATDFITARADDPDTPWFLYVAPTVPHTPYQPEPKYEHIPVPDPQINASNGPEADITDKPHRVQWFRSKAQAFLRSDRRTWPTGGRCADVSADGVQGWSECILDRIRPAQLRLLKSADDMVDRIFTTLDQTNQADNTLAFFTSDHGFLWNEHGMVEKPHPYYDMRIPLYMRWANHDLMKTTDSSLVANIDLMPTALAAARIPIPATVDGRNLLAPDLEPRDRLFLELVPRWASLILRTGVQYTEYYHGNLSPDLWGVRSARDDFPPGIPVREYYDLKADPLQLTNLMHDRDPDDPSEALLEALAQQLADARNCAGNGGITGPQASP